MRQRLSIFLFVVLVIVALVALNAASYAPIERKPDAEMSPNRSTFNAGASGTRALYDFLSESGYQVVRWRDPIAALDSGSSGNQRPGTFVVVGQTILPYSADEVRSLLGWVSRGNRLVLIDRSPDPQFLSNRDASQISLEKSPNVPFNVQSGDAEAMTAGAGLAHPVQPTSSTKEVTDIQPSRFASLIVISAADVDQPNGHTELLDDEDETGDVPTGGEKKQSARNRSGEPPPPPPPSPAASPVIVFGGVQPANPAPLAPVVQVANEKGPLLVEYNIGAGRVDLLSDPFIVSNTGISRADNLQLALNIIGSDKRIIAFDEFHQGQGKTENELIAYFRGTPLLAIVGQLSLIVILLVWTGGKRFGRPLPLPNVDRRSSLEFVASMAELQQRAGAYDLAIENIYTRLRRVLARYSGAASNLSTDEIAVRVADRSGLEFARIASLMRECEEAISGGPMDKQKAVDLIARLRDLERDLGVSSRLRDIRQEKEIK